MKKIALVGSSPRSRELAPYDDPSWEIWGINFGPDYMKRCDRLFDMHDLKKFPNPGLAEWSKQMQVYTRQEWDGIDCKVYPITEVIKHFGNAYFTNSTSYLIALAIYEIERDFGDSFKHYDETPEIGIFGTDMLIHEEYREQRPSCEYWLGIAQGKGIKLVMPENCELLKTNVLYGYNLMSDDAAKMRQARIDEVDQQIVFHQKEIARIKSESGNVLRELENKMCMFLGARDELRVQGCRL